MRRPGILIAEDHTLVLEAFKKLLSSEFDVIGTVQDGRSLLLLAPAWKPDVIVLDLGLPELSGTSAGPELRKILPCTKLVVVTSNEDAAVAHEATRAWASAYLLKKSVGSELIYAIREVLRGNSYISPRIAQGLQDEFIRDPRPERKRDLTAREVEVLRLLAEGRTMRETAKLLAVTPRTIAFHKYRIMGDFGLKSNSDLVMFALRHGVTPPL
ncbi:MAG TPA: response regulator transcription factor [Terriglobales bacterium]